MKRKIVIEIYANEKTCGKCKHVSLCSNTEAFCDIYDNLFMKRFGGGWGRLTECIAAPKDAGR